MKEERDGWVESKCFFGYAFEEWKLIEVGLMDFPVEADDVGELLLQALELVWASHELGHCPFDG